MIINRYTNQFQKHLEMCFCKVILFVRTCAKFIITNSQMLCINQFYTYNLYNSISAKNSREHSYFYFLQPSKVFPYFRVQFLVDANKCLVHIQKSVLLFFIRLGCFHNNYYQETNRIKQMYFVIAFYHETKKLRQNVQCNSKYSFLANPIELELQIIDYLFLVDSPVSIGIHQIENVIECPSNKFIVACQSEEKQKQNTEKKLVTLVFISYVKTAN